jgi:hypothetical protein
MRIAVAHCARASQRTAAGAEYACCVPHVVRNSAGCLLRVHSFASLRAWATFPLGNLLHGARTARDGEPSALLRNTTPCAGAMSRAGLPDAPLHAPTHTDAVAAVRAAAAAV